MPPDNPGSLNARALLRAWCPTLFLFAFVCASAAVLALPLKTEAAVTRVGSVVNEFTGTANSGSTNITVPNDAELMIAAVGGWRSGDPMGFFSDGDLSLGGNAFSVGIVGDTNPPTEPGLIFYLDVRSLNGPQTLAGDWTENGAMDEGVNVTYAFYTGVDFSGGPIRDSDRDYSNSSSLSVTGLTAVTGDMLVAVVTDYNSPGDAPDWTSVTQQLRSFNNFHGLAYAEGSPSGTASASVSTNASSAQLVAVIIKGEEEPPSDAMRTLSKPPNNLGLVGYWSFNEGTGTIATDFSGNGNTGTLQSIADPPTATSGWTNNGKRGKALNFDGSNDRVQVEHSSSLAIIGDMTIVAWIKLTDIVNHNGIIGKTSGGGVPAPYDFYLAQPSSIPSLWRGNGSAFNAVNATAAPTTAVWSHIAVTMSGTAVTHYLNGATNGAGTLSTTIGDSGGALRIGSRADLATLMKGGMDDVRIYNRALSAAEIAKLYGSGAVKINASSVELQRGSTLANGLVGLWTFDGQDTNWTSPATGVVYDRSGNNNTGTLTNMSQSGSPTAGKLGQALTFDGSNDVANVSYTGGLVTDTLSISLWFKTTETWNSSFWPANAVLIGMPTNGGASGDWALAGGNEGADGQIIWGTAPLGVSESKIASASSGLNDGEWHHVVATRHVDGETKLYIDGVLENTGDDGGGDVSGSRDLQFGGDTIHPGEMLNGQLDDVRIYNRALSPAEIQQLYKLGTVRITQ